VPRIVGTGCDLTPIARLRAAVQRHPRVAERVFTAREREEAAALARGRWERLAGLFAAKEAVAKALGAGLSRVSPLEVEVRHDPVGRPVVALAGRAEALARDLGVVAWHLSISHAGGFAVAMVIAEGAGRRPEDGEGRGCGCSA